jgi:hypothetical protein
MPRRADMAQKIYRVFDKRGHIRANFHYRQKQKEEENATNRGRGRTVQFQRTEGHARAVIADVLEHLLAPTWKLHIGAVKLRQITSAIRP